MSEKGKKILAALYVIGFVLGFMYVRTTLGTNKVTVATKGEVKLKPEVKDVKVNLDVNSKIYTYNLTTSENVFDLLELARKSNSIYFETIDYSERTDLDFIRYKFNMFLDGNDITNKLHETKLVDGKTYTLRLTPTRIAVPQ